MIENNLVFQEIISSPTSQKPSFIERVSGELLTNIVGDFAHAGHGSGARGDVVEEDGAYMFLELLLDQHGAVPVVALGIVECNSVFQQERHHRGFPPLVHATASTCEINTNIKTPKTIENRRNLSHDKIHP